ncbi:hypothetical protein SH1V18_15070 [Vallitalea longa]|uniref:ASCH domain-containing protein n=1 Tax=Vallitalea longa TaxID=2936439 RepID=A0A9W6DF19_9FIRM|nr:ASCH domain-containing protein [Vallitalea longa]GKX29027.1 hypothetical protein SH1V18_15070 [Vallitalea longa]
MQSKALTIIQPWATLIAMKAKKIETRSWKTKYRGEIYIHAGKKIDKDFCYEEIAKKVLNMHGYNIDNLPTGVVIAKANLIDCAKVVDSQEYSALLEGDKLYTVSNYEFHFGNYELGRYGWILDDIQLIDPIPAKGQLSIWNFEL